MTAKPLRAWTCETCGDGGTGPGGAARVARRSHARHNDGHVTSQGKPAAFAIPPAPRSPRRVR